MSASFVPRAVAELLEKTPSISPRRRVGVDLEIAKGREQARDIQSDNLPSAEIDLTIFPGKMAAVAVAAAGAADTDTLLIGAAIIPNQMNAGRGIEIGVVSDGRGTEVCSRHDGDGRATGSRIGFRLSKIDICSYARPGEVVCDWRC